MNPSSWVSDANMALLTDLYELTMMQAYVEEGLEETAVFDLFFRRLPENRNFLLACGQEDVLHYLENLRFSQEALTYLDSLDLFSQRFLDYLATFTFTGDVLAVPEGTPVFANEPVMEVIAPLPQAQLIETFVLNQLHFQTLAASKAARVVGAAEGRTVVDFGARRMHGTDATLKAARAFYIAGVQATSNVLAGQIYGIPVSGTMAHSYIEAHDDEIVAFEAFTQQFPRTVLLVDTYDTLEGVHRVAELASRWGEAFQVRAVRLDSGDLDHLAKSARKILDDAGLHHVEIFASSSLDEYAIADLCASGAPIDGFGVGTRMGVSQDAPSLDSAYKLVEYAGKPRMKLATHKGTLPGRKQIWRQGQANRYSRDLITTADETGIEGTPLLQHTFKGGQRLSDLPSTLESIREYAQKEIAYLPSECHRLHGQAAPYPVSLSSALEKATERLRQALHRGE